MYIYIYIYIYSEEANNSVHNMDKKNNKKFKKDKLEHFKFFNYYFFFSATGIIIEFSSCLFTLLLR